MSKLGDILKGLDDRALVMVPTPEWQELDGQLFAKRMNPIERQEFWEAWNKLPKDALTTLALATCGVVDSDGNRAFDTDDYATLATKASGPIERLSAKVDELNIVTISAQEAFAKNFGTPQNS